MLARRHLERVFFVEVAQRTDIVLPEQRIGIEIELGVERDEPAVGRLDQRVDLEQRGVGLEITRQQREKQVACCCVHRLRQAHADRQPCGVSVAQPVERIDRDADDGLRVASGDLLDLHAAVAAADEGKRLRGAVGDHCEVVLVRDADRLLDPQSANQLPLCAGLRGAERMAEHAVGGVLDRPEAVDHFDAAAFAAPPGVDLRLDHPAATAKRTRRLCRFGCGVDQTAAWDRHAVAGEELFALIFVDLHAQQPTEKRRRRCLSQQLFCY